MSPRLGAATQWAVGEAACCAIVQTLADYAGTPLSVLPHTVNLTLVFTALARFCLASGKGGLPLTW